jgi:GNAT superfamily N-acetyltransferase
MPISIRPLTESDLPAALRLSTQSGWNQTLTHWRRLLALWPKSCLVYCDNDDVIATATLASFGPVGWVGMVLVDEARRGGGVGKAMFAAVLETAAKLNVTTLGLDATDMGRPLYQKLGFVDQCSIDRWICNTPSQPQIPDKAASSSQRLITPLASTDWPALDALDHAATSANRHALLRHLTTEPQTLALTLRDHAGVLTGFGFLQEGRLAHHIGPVVAPDVAGAMRLVRALREACHQSHEPRPIIIDVLRQPDHDAALTSAGFSVQRRLTRMSKPASASTLLGSPTMFAGAGFELG